MAPKKKTRQQQKQPEKSTKAAPKLTISAENERRLRRLLMNSRRSDSSAGITDGEGSLSRGQKAKKLRSVYDKLSLEGFSSEQIERALSALAEGATFEAALDWLCFNLRGDELPLKFSSAGSASSIHEGADTSVKVISRAQEGWVPTQLLNEVEDEMLAMKIKTKGPREEASIIIGESSQSDWIKKYVRQLEEDDELEKIEQENQQEEVSSKHRAKSVIEEYNVARMAALEAKRAKDKNKQSHFNGIIRNLKQEIISLGLLGEIKVESEGHLESSEFRLLTSSKLDMPSDLSTQLSQHIVHENETVKFENQKDSNLEETDLTIHPSSVSAEARPQDEQDDDLEFPDIDNLFDEDVNTIPIPDALTQGHKQTSQFSQGEFPRELFPLVKKGDTIKCPKAVLQKVCQHFDWDAPKYSKILEKESKYAYSVNILRKAMGRGKGRKVGGLITLHLPSQEFNSVEHAQNAVAAFAIYQLFPDFPVHELVIEPYVSAIRRWQEGEQMTKSFVHEEERRSGFVENLLNIDRSSAVSSSDVADIYLVEPTEVSSTPQKRERGIMHNPEAESNILKREMKRKLLTSQYREMQNIRYSLPIATFRDQLLQLLKENNTLVVCGETGCGKTTQVPQFILDDMIESGQGGYCNIICTQPRRIAAISVAERVSEERCEPSPGSANSLVGYQVRLDSARSERTKLLFCTTGILLRRLSDDKDLIGVSHVIVDEVHERSLLGDFLLVVLKSLIERQAAMGLPVLKLVLMSATVDSTLFSRYFGNCPVITAKGRTFPVMSFFLEDIYEKLKYSLPSDSSSAGRRTMSERAKINQNYVDNSRGKKHLVLSSWGDEQSVADEYVNPYYNPSSYEEYSEQTRQNLKRLNEDVVDYDLLEDLILHIDNNCSPGAVLIFLPGVAEIYLLIERLRGSYHFRGVSSDWILPLHSTLSSLEQKKVFLSPPGGIRKVIVATDIAETSITIDDIVYVIDSGKHKEKRYNPQKKMSSIVEDWISRANAKQRQGRAGRVKPGNCFFLYTRYRFDKCLRSFQVPEILRVPLTEVSLQIKLLELGEIRSFLTKAIEPPRQEAISTAIDTLHEVGAIDDKENMTPLGYHLAKLPVDVLIGKMMLYGAIFSCLSPILSVAAFLSHKSPFLTSKEEKETTEKAKLMMLACKDDGTTEPSGGMRQSDHLLMIVAYNKWSQVLHKEGDKAAQNFCRSNSLSASVMFMIREIRIQFGNLLADIGLINLPTYTQGSGKTKDRLDQWFNDAAQSFNTYSHLPCVVRAIICAGLYPNVAATDVGITGPAQGSIKEYSVGTVSKGRPLWHDGKRIVHIHPSSVNHSIEEFRYPFLVFLEKIETSKVFLRETTIVSPYSVLLFGGNLSIQHRIGVVIIDGWLKLKASAQTAVLFKELRTTLHTVLRELIKKPEAGKVSDNEVVRTIVHLLLEEDKQ